MFNLFSNVVEVFFVFSVNDLFFTTVCLSRYCIVSLLTFLSSAKDTLETYNLKLISKIIVWTVYIIETTMISHYYVISKSSLRTRIQ